ncbi:MAG: cyclase family protein [Dehalococcoidia bacterium]
MTQQRARYTIDDVRELCRRCNNWGRWGPDDELGTLNFITPEKIVEASRLVKKGRVFSLAIPFDANGPQNYGGQRFNPIHWMLRDGGDVVAGLGEYTDDAVMMPLQSASQWDSLAHAFFEGKMYNDRGPELVTSFGAQKNSIEKFKERIVSRGVLLDIARYKGKRWLEGGEIVYTEDLDGCAAREGVEVRRGDIVFIRMGQMAEVKERGHFGTYSGGDRNLGGGPGPSPGLSITTSPWFHGNELAGYATDTCCTDVIPNEVEDIRCRMPLHRILIVHCGILMGEIFDLDELAEDCAQDGVYEFMTVAPVLPVTGAVGSPVNPQAIK